MIRFVIPAYDEAENIPRLLEEPRAGGAQARRPRDRRRRRLRATGPPRSCAPTPATCTSRSSSTRSTAASAPPSTPASAPRCREASDDDAIVTLEADTTSDLDDLPRMLEEFDKGADMVLASVYMPGGALLGVSQKRIALSKSVSTTFRYLGGLQNLHTLSSLYRVYRAGTLRKAADTYGYLLVREPGFAANVELLLKLYAAGATIAEVPTTNDWSTRKGQSKMKLKPTALAYFRVMIAHLAGRIQPPARSPLADVGAAALAAVGCAGAWPARGRAIHRADGPGAGRGRAMSRPQQTVAVVGGGILGSVLALRLAETGAQGDAARARADLRRAGGHDGLRRPPGRPLLPRHHAGGLAHDRLAEELGLGDQLRFSPGRSRLLHRRRDARLQRRRRPAALQAADADPAPAPGLVRGAVPGAAQVRPPRRPARSRSTCAATAAGPGRPDLEAAAGLALRGQARGPARHLPLVAHATHVDRPRGWRQRGGVRPPDRRSPAPDRRDHRPCAGARRRAASRRAGRGPRARRPGRRRRARRRRGRALRPHDPDAAAARAGQAAAGGALAPARAVPQALAGLRLRGAQDHAPAAALLRDQHLRADADHERGRDDPGRRHRAHRRAPPRLPAALLRAGRAGADRGRELALRALHGAAGAHGAGLRPRQGRRRLDRPARDAWSSRCTASGPGPASRRSCPTCRVWGSRPTRRSTPGC